MSSRFLRYPLAQDEAITASTVITYDLPVNPLSHILFTLKWQDGAAIGNTLDLFAATMAFVSRIEVLYKGQAIISGSWVDLAMLNHRLTGWGPQILNLVDAANEVKALTTLISFSRRPYWPAEAFPAVRRGELQLQVTYTAAVGTVDSPVAQIETVELMDAAPAQFLKYTTITKTPSATGEHDVDLPIGNPILGCLLFGTTVPTGTSYNATLGKVKLLVDNVDTYYGRTNWETLHNEFLMRAPHSLAGDRHTHAQAVNTDVVTGIQLLGITHRERYAYLDFDPLQDGSYMLETQGRARVNLRIDQEPTADALRVIPIELIMVAKGAAA